MNTYTRLLFPLILFVSVSCTTTRTWDGPDPNFTLHGEPARQELDHYTLREDGFFHQRQGFYMGPRERLYSLESLTPMMKRVTPETAQTASRIERGFKLNRIVGWTSLALLVAGSMVQDDLQVTLVGLGGTGAIWWAGRDSWLRWQLTKVSPAFNDELQSKFAPRFSWNKQF